MTYLEILAKNRILECQFNSSKMAGFPEQICGECQDRFVCLTLKAHKFEVTKFRESWMTYEIVAEDKDEAIELLLIINGKKVGGGWSNIKNMKVEEIYHTDV